MAYRPYESDDMSADEPTSELASPWARLAAVIIDWLIYLVVAAIGFLGTYFAAGPWQSERIMVPVLLGLLLLTVLVQLVLLGSRGQTVGKIVMKVRIVDSVTGMHPGWARIILLRTVVNGILRAIPGVGFAYYLVDSLFIFRADRRTIHDFIAGTRVDKVSD